MTGSSSAGALLVGAGLALVVIGLLVWSGGLHWFGRLPGDIRIERADVRVYIPITSMLLSSAAASILVWIVRRFAGSSGGGP